MSLIAPSSPAAAQGRSSTRASPEDEYYRLVTIPIPEGIVFEVGGLTTLPDGRLAVLVGPSGCGKTTLLRCVAGLEALTDGTVKIGDRVVNEVSPKDRDLAMVFQDYALYPQMSVYDNMAFSLKLRRMPKPEVRKRVDDVARTLGLS